MDAGFVRNATETPRRDTHNSRRKDEVLRHMEVPNFFSKKAGAGCRLFLLNGIEYGAAIHAQDAAVNVTARVAGQQQHRAVQFSQRTGAPR